MSFQEYNEEFYKMTIRYGHRDIFREKVARYINGMILNIQDKLCILRINTVEDVYQYALKTEDKVKRRH